MGSLKWGLGCQEVGLRVGLGDEVGELLTLAGKVAERLKMGLGFDFEIV